MKRSPNSASFIALCLVTVALPADADRKTSSENRTDHRAAQKLSMESGILRSEAAHADKLTPVHEFLRAGVKFDDAEVDKLAPTNNWFKIPGWMANGNSKR